MLYLLSYFSTATARFNHAELSKIIDTAVTFNEQSDITGLLCYHVGCFFQFLEGEESAVKRLYEKIKKDPRHSGCFITLEKPIEKRLFDKWYMALCNVDDFEGHQKEVLLELFKVSLDRRGSEHARLVEALLETCKRAELGAANSAPWGRPQVTVAMSKSSPRA